MVHICTKYSSASEGYFVLCYFEWALRNKLNVLDLLLPRILAGEKITHQDITVSKLNTKDC